MSQFRRVHKVWPELFIGLLAVVTTSASEAADARATGKVLDTEGKPVANAKVIVWTAAVKQGYSTYCPSCYPDCGKRTSTAADGTFALERLNSELRFRLLVVAEGFRPTFVEKVDPLGEAVVANLEIRERPKDPSHIVRGRVVDENGNAVIDALVEPEMVRFVDENGREGGRGGAVEGLEPLAITNAKGEFDLAYVKPAINMSLMVKAPRMAPKRFLEVPSGVDDSVLKVSSGATVRGRLVQRRQPVSGAEMGIVLQDRSADVFIPEVRIGTQSDGRFEFVNVPAPGEWFVYAKMESILGRQGATKAVTASTTADGDVVELGDIEIEPGHTIRGQVLLTDGKPIPDGMRIFIFGQTAWDGLFSMLPPDGQFEFKNLRTDDYSLSPAVKGYRYSFKNPNLSWSIEGRINRDVDDFVILLEPGNDTFQGRRAGKFKGQELRSAARP